MRFLFVNDFHVPQLFRGTEVNTHALCGHLKAMGHEPLVACALIPTGALGLQSRVKLKLGAPRAWVRDDAAGYTTYRSWDVAKTLRDVTAHAKPDVIVVQTGDRAVAELAAHLDLPTLHYLHFIPDWPTLPLFANGRYITNSMFCQSRIEAIYGARSVVVRPIVRPEDYRANISRKEVTSFSMLLDKGADIVVELAKRNPDIPFRVYANHRSLHERDRLLMQQATALSNVVITPSRRSSGEIYRKTRLVLAPSRWQETWGRMATEAHVNAIPVLASDRGGLPEAVGTGGRCLSPETPIEEWNAALRQMFFDRDAFSAYQHGAQLQHLSPLVNPELICEEFVRQAELLATTRSFANRASAVSPLGLLPSAGVGASSI